MTSRDITVKVESTRLIFGEGVAFSVEQIVVDHPSDHAARVLSFDSERFPWITLFIYPMENGVLSCDVCDFKPRAPRFGELPIDVSTIRKIILFHDSPKVSALVAIERQKAEPLPPVRPPPRPVPVVRPEPPEDVVEEVSFSAPLEQFCFLDGAVEIKRDIYFKKSLWPQRVCFRFENGFFSPKLNCIRSYLAKAFGGRPVAVNATVHIRNGELIVERVKAPALDRISSGILSQVRFHFVKGELKNRSGKRIITARRFFGELAEAGFDESDADFVADIVRAKNVKHSPQIEYLVGLHDGSQIRLRLIRDPFSFLFFIPGESSCCFAWETLDGTDATYLWRLQPLAYYLDGNRGELKKSLNEVERAIDHIYACGRNEYLKAAPSQFLRVFHDYENGNGFEHWKEALERQISGNEFEGNRDEN